jgi:quercetin dioxygenase-like cupin family protein
MKIWGMSSCRHLPTVQLAFAALSLLLCLCSRAENAAPAASAPETTLTSAVFEWDKLPVKKTATGEHREIVEGRTPTLAQFRSHVTTLNPGTPWSNLDKHTDEEIVIVKEGTLEYEINGHLQKANPGAVILIIAGEAHRSRNAGTTPATYYVFHAVTAAAKAAVTPASLEWPIVVRRGDQLFEGEKPFRFFGLAAPNLQANESQFLTDFSNRFPDEFEIRDILGGLQRLGARATRTFSLSIFHPADNGVPVYISARLTYNEEAFRCLDRVLALCAEYDVRVIIPFIASQSFGTIRGVDEFAQLAGKPGIAFWTDPEVKEDFKHFLRFILSRRNTITGRLYKDDPAILAWQLGNEFGSYSFDRRLDAAVLAPDILAWSREMAATIKQLDPNHLVMDANGCDREALLADPNIDVISEHLYEYWNRLSGQPSDLAPLARAVRAQCKDRKPLIIDEFGLGSVENQRTLMRTIREEGIVGGLMWSIRGHRRDGGWYYHNEGGTPVNSFHVPGFAAGFAYEETRLLDLLRNEAYGIRGQQVPPVAKPLPAPMLFRAGDGLTWRGSTGASSYILERAESVTGPWTIVARDLEDSVIADAKNYEANFGLGPQPTLALYHDETTPIGKLVYYRLKGINRTGETDYSAVLVVPASR